MPADPAPRPDLHVQALVDAGLRIDLLREWPYSNGWCDRHAHVIQPREMIRAAAAPPSTHPIAPADAWFAARGWEPFVFPRGVKRAR